MVENPKQIEENKISLKVRTFIYRVFDINDNTNNLKYIRLNNGSIFKDFRRKMEEHRNTNKSKN